MTLKSLAMKYKHAWLLLYYPIYLIWFFYLEKTVVWHFNIVHVELDDMIPFCEYFIVPYLLWFLYNACGILVLFYKDVKNYNLLMYYLIIGMTVFLIVSTIYPNGHYLRPTRFEHNNIFTFLVKNLYATDTATNLFPSIHVYNSIGIHIALMKSNVTNDKKWITIPSFVLMISIILSTMFLKQHSVFDVVTGLLLAAFVYILVYKEVLSSVKNHFVSAHAPKNRAKVRMKNKAK
ncbi:PAP2 superfamily protein [Acetitomaculum ruminis DSM 5522]|uniref:PAP2 superfamily protein n=1 Tax=Acetitomaculum ruminis DSM 5522 TaxID=1120918 RepID=A0A1I0VQY1_9FIRM|nr:phosphatase PAP2 family protein [Acetitomaculum ruminis]SFA78795.1 PAP2 superfamily protein [Acetitomaculum ruminis DSM 5522]